jgi:hypothetical protein
MSRFLITGSSPAVPDTPPIAEESAAWADSLVRRLESSVTAHAQ